MEAHDQVVSRWRRIEPAIVPETIGPAIVPETIGPAIVPENIEPAIVPELCITFVCLA